MRIVVASHAYGVDERMKVLERIGEQHEVTLIAPEVVSTQVFGALHAPTSATIDVVANPTWRLGRRGHFLFRPQWRRYRGLRADVLHIEYDPWTPEFWSVAGPLMLLSRRAPVVLTVRKNTRHIPSGVLGWAERLLTALGMRRVRRLLAVSARAAAVYADLGYRDTPAEVQGHMPIDPGVFAAREPGAVGASPVVGYVGSIAPHKGIHELIDATAAVRSSTHPGARLLLVGPMRDEELDRRIATLDWVEYDGPRENRELPAALARMDLFVMPSLILPDHEEHDAHALLEAMATGLPSVGTRSGIMTELLDDGVNGWLVEPGDAEGLAAAVRHGLEDEDRRRRIGLAGRATALEFAGLDGLAARRAAAYEKVTS